MERFNLEELKKQSALEKRYEKQIERIKNSKLQTDHIERAVSQTTSMVRPGRATSLVIYGDPQSGKTEMMICLTAKLLDANHKVIVHLMNDSVDLLTQNLRRFKSSGLAPAPRNSSELPDLNLSGKHDNAVVFCKKNAKDLEKLIQKLEGVSGIVVIDDEADYATPNGKINKGKKTRINQLVEKLIGENGVYLGVTATPARLNLNNTFENDPAKWICFDSHRAYTGQDTFFPVDKKFDYRLNFIDEEHADPKDAQRAFIRFLVTVAFLNEHVNKSEQNYSFLVHTSGKKQDHSSDLEMIEESINILRNKDDSKFESLARMVFDTAQKLYPSVSASAISNYVIKNISRATPVVLNSERDRAAAGDNPAEPTSPFTIIIGGNIVSRGVTFPNLLAMFFTRNVRHKMQQDTYIQRARMFGARTKYLEHFELTIPEALYWDWHKCFVFHRLALQTIKSNLGLPVWLGDKRISVASSNSIDKTRVALDKGEMSFGLFDYSDKVDDLILTDQTSIKTIDSLQGMIGKEALPDFLIQYIRAAIGGRKGLLAVHSSSSIAGYGDSADHEAISREKGFMGKPQMEPSKFPDAVHHIKVFRNSSGKARVFYKYRSGIQFIQNRKLGA